MTTTPPKRPHKRLPVTIHSHWEVTIDGLCVSVKEAYESLEEMFLAREFPTTRIGPARFKEAGFFSSKRGYIRVVYHNLSYDICVCPFGTSTFVSSWLGERSSSFFVNLLSGIPILGFVIRRGRETRTYYQYDSLMAFQELVHATVLEWLDEVTTAHGIKPIDNSLRKPVMKNLLKGFPGDTTDWGNRWDLLDTKAELLTKEAESKRKTPDKKSIPWFPKEG